MLRKVLGRIVDNCLIESSPALARKSWAVGTTSLKFHTINVWFNNMPIFGELIS